MLPVQFGWSRYLLSLNKKSCWIQLILNCPPLTNLAQIHINIFYPHSDPKKLCSSENDQRFCHVDMQHVTHFWGSSQLLRMQSVIIHQIGDPFSLDLHVDDHQSPFLTAQLIAMPITVEIVFSFYT